MVSLIVSLNIIAWQSENLTNIDQSPPNVFSEIEQMK